METVFDKLLAIENFLKEQTFQQKEYLTVEETAKFLGCSISHIRKLCHYKKLRYYKASGKLVMIKRSDLIDFIEMGLIKSEIDLENEADAKIFQRNHKR